MSEDEIRRYALEMALRTTGVDEANAVELAEKYVAFLKAGHEPRTGQAST